MCEIPNIRLEAIPPHTTVVAHLRDGGKVGTTQRMSTFPPYNGGDGEPLVLRKAHGRALHVVYAVVPACNISWVEVVR